MYCFQGFCNFNAGISYVTPLLEYASCVWSPHAVGLIKKIESVQRQFTRRLSCCAKLLNYSAVSALLLKLGVDSLELRRLRFDLIYAYKIMASLLDTNSDAVFELYKTNVTHGHCCKLYVPQSRIEVYKYFFSRRIIQCWNNLSACPEDFSSLSAFKRLLNRSDLSQFTLCYEWFGFIFCALWFMNCSCMHDM